MAFQTPLAPATLDAGADRVSESTAPIQVASLAAGAAALLSACGGGGGSDNTVPGMANPVPVNANYRYTSASNDQDAARLLLQAQFSATGSDIAAVRSQGYANWLQQQVARPQSGSGWDWLEAQGYGDVQNTARYYDSSSQADYMVWHQLITAPDGMRKRMALALSEFFVVSASGLNFTWRSHAIAHYWDTLNTHAFGNYRTLLEAVTLNVAMGYYLNTKGNQKANGKGSQPDENYAREVMQLFSLGLVLLNPDGTAKLTDGKASDTYTASDISNLAHVFTGYDVDQSQNVDTLIPQTGGGTRKVGNTAFARLPMVLTDSKHSFIEISFLGIKIAANTPAKDALKTALDTLFQHPNTAPFFCKQMIQRLVTSNPSPAYVQRVAARFADNGNGVRGDLAAVWLAILLDDEARGPAGLSDSAFGKLREPMLRFVQWARTFGANSTSGLWKIGDLSNPGSQLGQSPLRSPSVFNFFRPGYVPPTTSLGAGAVAPEFQLVNEGSVGGYLNFMTNVLSRGLNSGDIKAGYGAELALVTDAAALVQHLNTVLCAGQLNAANQALMVTALNANAVTAASTDSVKKNRVYAAALMVLASANYLIQK